MTARCRLVWSALSVRYLRGTPHEDDRIRNARFAGILLLLGAAAGMGMLPVLPERVDQTLAFVLAALCLALGGVVPWLPWHRWPQTALVCPLALAFLVVMAGGLLGGDLDYYALFFPLLFIYCGHSFPARYSGWLFLLSLLGLSLTAFSPQLPGTVPFVLLGTLLAAVCGVVLALQRQEEQRGQEAMRQLVEVAGALGAAKAADEVARLIASTASSLLDAHGVAVLLPTRDAAETAVSAALGRPGAAGGAGDRADGDVLDLLGRAEASASPAGRPDGARAHVMIIVPLVLPGSGSVDAPPSSGRDGAIVCELRSPIRHRDHFTVRTLELLAVEGGRVLERLQHAETLLQRSRTDPLTGLGNRLVLDTALAAARPGATVMLLDLDHFKLVNDRLGHAVGDRVLVCFADVLRQTMRADQVSTRYGGEEFALVITDLPADGLARYLTSLRRQWADSSPHTTYSCGVAIQADGETGAEALVRADRAMYRAKDQGRDRDVLDDGHLRSLAALA